MNINLILGGYLVDARGDRYQLPVVSSPLILLIGDTIKKVSRAGKGVVALRRQPQPESGPYELEVHVDSGNYLLMLNVFDENGEHFVRTPMEENAENNFIDVLGEKYPVQAVKRDINFVCAVFKEFAQTGNVSTELLR